MKYLYQKLTAALLFLFLTFNAKATNDTLTIGQAFNWSVGDTLIYRSLSTITTSHHGQTETHNNSSIIGFVVLSRVDFTDSVAYVLQYFFDDTTIRNFTISNKNQSLIAQNIFSNLYRGICSGSDFPKYNHHYFQDPGFNNLITDSFFRWGGAPEGTTTFVEKVGIKNHTIWDI